MSLAHLELLLNNRQPHEEYAPRIKWDMLERAVADFKAMADRICSCKQAEPFEVNTRNDRPYQIELALKQAGRVRAVDQASGFSDVYATVETQRASGDRLNPWIEQELFGEA